MSVWKLEKKLEQSAATRRTKYPDAGIINQRNLISCRLLYHSSVCIKINRKTAQQLKIRARFIIGAYIHTYIVVIYSGLMSLRTAKPLEAWGKKCLVGREGKLKKVCL